MVEMPEPAAPAVQKVAPPPPDVPVLVDDVKRLDEGAFEMTRCAYFAIEVTTAVHDWVADLTERGVPFLLLGPTPVLHRPGPDSSRFDDPTSLDILFDAIEEVEGLVVETGHIWLPNVLVERALGPEVMGDPETSRGAVLRVPLPAFQAALRFVRDTLSAERFVALVSGEGTPGAPQIQWSPEESRVFREWSRLQIREASENYLRQREDGRGVLRWRDAEGDEHEG